MYDLDAPTLFLSLLITWIIGLAPPFLIRFALLRRPMGTWAAVGACAGFWLLNILIFTAMGSRSKTHGALLLVGVVSFWILKWHERASTGTLHNRSAKPAASFATISRSPDITKELPANAHAHQESRDKVVAPVNKFLESMPQSDSIVLKEEALDQLYARAMTEVESGQYLKGTWARAYAEADGDEPKARARYISARVSQLIEEERRRIEAIAVEQQVATVEQERNRLRRMEERERYLAFRLAARNGELAKVEEILRISPELLDYQDPDDEKTALIMAVHGSQPQMVRLLLSFGASLERKDAQGKTALDWARETGSKELLSAFSLGLCPNCDAAIPLNSEKCGKCGASFKDGAAWKILPYFEP